jgi:hypothetical protein
MGTREPAVTDFGRLTIKQNNAVVVCSIILGWFRRDIVGVLVQDEVEMSWDVLKVGRWVGCSPRAVETLIQAETDAVSTDRHHGASVIAEMRRCRFPRSTNSPLHERQPKIGEPSAALGVENRSTFSVGGPYGTIWYSWTGRGGAMKCRVFHPNQEMGEKLVGNEEMKSGKTTFT